MYGMRNGIEGFMREMLVELNERFETPAELELLKNTPASALGSCRVKLKDDEQLEIIFKLIEKYDIKYFFYIGGNDSMDAVAKLEEYRSQHS